MQQSRPTTARCYTLFCSCRRVCVYYCSTYYVASGNKTHTVRACFCSCFCCGTNPTMVEAGRPEIVGTSCACTAGRHACAGLHKCARCRCFVNWPRWTAERPCCCSHAALQSCSKQGLGPPCAQGVEVLTDFVSCVQGALGHAAAVLRAAEAMENRPHFRTGVFSVFGYEKSGPGRGGARRAKIPRRAWRATQGLLLLTYYYVLLTTYTHIQNIIARGSWGTGAQKQREKVLGQEGDSETALLCLCIY